MSLWSVVGGWSVGGGFVLRPTKLPSNAKCLVPKPPQHVRNSLVISSISDYHQHPGLDVKLN